MTPDKNQPRNQEQVQKDLQDWLALAPESRDSQWEEKFFHLFMQAKVQVLSPDPITGPDTWPYLAIESSLEGTEDTQKIMAWLEEKGLGLVLNPEQEYPDFVFNYGMVWNFRKTGRFYLEAKDIPTGEVILGAGAKFGNPGSEYFPAYVRKVLRDFFRDQNLYGVKILGVLQENHLDLGFSLASLGNPPKSEHQGILEAISWFLPSHYSLALLQEEGLPAFFDL